MSFPISLRLVFFAGSLSLAALMPGRIQAAPLAYDGFAAGGASPGSGEYVSTPASTNGVNNNALFNQGPALTGFSGTWTGTSGDYNSSVYYRINAAGLSYGSLQTSLGEVELFRSAGSSSFLKALTRPTTYTGGGSLYISMLLNYNFVHATDVKFFPGVNSLSIGTNLGGQAVIRDAGVVKGNSSASLSTDVTHLIVARINTGGTFSLWLDPADLSSEAANVAVATGSGITYTSGLSFTSMEINTNVPAVGNSTIFDEIRFGSTWGDVLPVPEPASSVLVGLSLTCLIATRRRMARKNG